MHPAGIEVPVELIFSLFTAAFLYLSFDGDFLKIIKYTIYLLMEIFKKNKYTIFAEYKDAAVRSAPPPPPIIFERLKLPQQIIYRWKGNLSESPYHFKYREDILILQFY